MTKEKYMRDRKLVSIASLAFIAAFALFLVIWIILVSTSNISNIYQYDNYGNWYGDGKINVANTNGIKSANSIAKIVFTFFVLSFAFYSVVVTFDYVNNIKFNKLLLDGKGMGKGEVAKTSVWSIVLFASMLLGLITLIIFLLVVDFKYLDETNYYGDYSYGFLDSGGEFISLSSIVTEINDIASGSIHIGYDEAEEFVYNLYINGNEAAEQLVWQYVHWDYLNTTMFILVMYLPISLAMGLISTKATTSSLLNTAVEKVDCPTEVNSYSTNNSYATEKEKETLSTKGKALVTAMLVTSFTAITLVFWMLFTSGEFFVLDGIIPKDKTFFGPLTIIVMILVVLAGVLNAVFSAKTLNAGNGTKVTSIMGITYGSLLGILSLLGIIMIPARLTVLLVLLVPAGITITSSIMLLLSDEDGNGEGDSKAIFISGIVTAAIISLGMKFSLILAIASFAIGVVVIVLGTLSLTKENLVKVVFILAIVLGCVLAIESIANAISANKMYNLITYVPIRTFDKYTLMYLLANIPAALTLIGLGAFGLKQY